ncbi:hypothetical protein GTW43_32510 [Streptomyces sp. SID5785]|uniref:hypothetical protein n=1 Tax=Streptomyces sp. SID5785 TaxID=2690309 RepID=UPI001360CD45|nr:hypothetical protein [Streptomyces sp. SID5785]MZD09769.1 hypothetical protein [Streptomyces sp. SID5785]
MSPDHTPGDGAPAAPHAEVEQVWPRDGRIRVVGRLHGTPPRPGAVWQLLAVRRGHGGDRIRRRAVVRGDRFDGELTVEDLTLDDAPTAAAPPTDGDRWDLHLTDGAATLRVGRRLDDIRGRKAVMVYPWQPVPGTSCEVRPYYTVEDNLSLECRA